MQEKNPLIVVIEDDETLGEMVSSLVRQETSYGILVFPKCDVFFQYLDQGGIVPNVIIIDRNLPGMDAEEFLTFARNHDRLSIIPIALFTATSFSTLGKAFISKFNGAIEKPFDVDEFLCLLDRLLTKNSL